MSLIFLPRLITGGFINRLRSVSRISFFIEGSRVPSVASVYSFL